MQQYILYRLLSLTTNTKTSLSDAASYFHCLPQNAGVAADDLLSNYSLRADERATTLRFLSDDGFARNLIRCLAFAASCKLDLWICSDRMESLVEDYNIRFGEKVDAYRVLSLLDVATDLDLSDTSAASICPPWWPSFLAAVSVVNHCSVWEDNRSLAQTLLKDVPTSAVPTWMLCWIIDEGGQKKLIRDLVYCRASRTQEQKDQILYHLLLHGVNISTNQVQAILEAIQDSLTAERLELLLESSVAPTVSQFVYDAWRFENRI